MEFFVYYTFGTVPKSNRKIVERGKHRYPYNICTQIHDRSLFLFVTGTAIKSDRLLCSVVLHNGIVSH